MNKSKVALVKCDNYEYEQVCRAVEKGIGLLGGISNFLKPGEKIVMKPNVLIGSDPKKCVTTHPSVLKAVGRQLKQVSSNIYCGDSPVFGKCEANLKRAGLKQVVDELDIKIADFDNGQAVIHKEALLNKRFVLARGVLEAEGLVSIPKLKAHALMRVTGAVKNQFGCIPGHLKSQYHVKMPDPYKFATMLVDLNTLIKPRLYIMDAIIAMEGNGPNSGTPKKLGVMLFSSDPVALDAIACKIIDLKPEFVPTCLAGEKAGLGTYRYNDIEVIGGEIEPLIDKDFAVVRSAPPAYSPGFRQTFWKNRLCPRPVIDVSKCTACGMCVDICPVDPKAVDWHTGDKSKPPTHKYDRCIRCYCCQEICPAGAIEMRNTMLGKILYPLK